MFDDLLVAAGIVFALVERLVASRMVALNLHFFFQLLSSFAPPSKSTQPNYNKQEE
jgi:hypothetical protein